MKIDITPILEQANCIDKLCLDLREIDALYVIRLANGSDYSTKWSRKELDQFCPNRTVSEMLVKWEESITHQYNTVIKALETGLHPTWTKTIDELNTKTNLPTGKLIIVAESLDTYHSRNGFEKQAKELKKQFGKLSFIKIC